MPCLCSLIRICALCCALLPLPALAAGMPESRFFSQDDSDYILAAEVADNKGLDAALDAAESKIREAERISSPEAAIVPARRATFHCIYAWMQLSGQAASLEQRGRARELLGRVRAFFAWDKPELDRMAARAGSLLQEVITAREAREAVSRGIDPREAAAARSLER